MDMECGKKDQELVINIKDNIKLIKNMVMVSSHGHQETSIKEIINKI